MSRLFGTDGIRGVANKDLTPELALRLGRAAGHVLGGPGHRVVVGRDTRRSGRMLESALAAGLCSVGMEVRLVGHIPTPGLAYLARTGDFVAGAVISASHNPAPDNGIKFFSSTGMKLPDEVEDAIEAELGVPDEARPRLDGAEGAIRELSDEGRERYLTHLEGTALARLDGMRVVVDCANGAASAVAPELLRGLGADVTAIHAEPDGMNINDGCGALHPEVVAAEVVRLGADAGVSLDGDADRALFADRHGAVIDGDQVLAACAVAMRDAGTLHDDTVVATVMANLGFWKAMERERVRVVQASVGDRYVLEEMERIGATLGGEQSGHVIFRRHATTGDGLLTAVTFLSIAAASGRDVGDLAAVMRRYPQVMVNVRVRDREALAGASLVWEAVSGVEGELDGRGRVLVRASGTEPLVRVMAEAETEGEARAHVDSIVDVVRAELG
jgi:phosphoglucosamine mutase